MKKVIIIYLFLFPIAFVLSLYTNKYILNDNCYRENRCYKDIMASSDESNIMESFIEAIISPLTIPTNIYLSFNYKDKR